MAEKCIFMDDVGFVERDLKDHCPMEMLASMEKKYKISPLRDFLKRTHFFLDIEDHSHVTFFWMDDKWTYLGGNEALLKLLGLDSYEKILGKKNIELILSWERDLLISEKLDCMNQWIVTNGDYCLLEEEIGEEEKILSVKGPLLNKDGITKGLIGMSKFNFKKEE